MPLDDLGQPSLVEADDDVIIGHDDRNSLLAGLLDHLEVDADIDNAAGIGHVFQVLRNWITHGTTHPYDIHQILVFRQEVVLPYDLA